MILRERGGKKGVMFGIGKGKFPMFGLDEFGHSAMTGDGSFFAFPLT